MTATSQAQLSGRAIDSTPAGAVSAIVVTYNSAEHIGATLRSLRAARLQVCIVDNASTDGTVDLVLREFPDMALCVNASNEGFARAVNRGLAEIRGDIVLLVNPDCVLGAHTADGLARFLLQHPDVGVVGPRILAPGGAVTISAHPFESLVSVLASRFGGSLLPVGLRRMFSGPDRRKSYDACRGPLPPTPVDWVSGACLGVRTEILCRLGGLDGCYFLYYEDEELCWQAQALGSKVYYLPDLQAIHIGGASSELGTTWPQLYRSLLIFFHRHRRASFQPVRFVIMLRAVVGLGMSTLRPPGRGRSLRRSAWWQVVKLTGAASGHTMQDWSRPVPTLRHQMKDQLT